LEAEIALGSAGLPLLSLGERPSGSFALPERP
jgi:hypothetical protein